jgi:hypothetical protein
MNRRECRAVKYVQIGSSIVVEEYINNPERQQTKNDKGNKEMFEFP